VVNHETAPYRVPPAVLVLFAVVILIAFAPFARTYTSTAFNGIDFEAFYCGGQVLASHGDPYLQEPLHSCEARVHWKEHPSDLLVPLPQPPVVVAAFIPLGDLPYEVARALWFVSMCAALTASIFLVGRMYDIWWPAVAIAIAMSGVLSLILGQVVPLCLFGIVAAAYGLRIGRSLPIIVGLLALAVQPSVFVAVAAACLVFGTSRTRIAASIAISGFAGASLLVSGVQTNVLYLSTILPLHNYAELTNSLQFSLSGILAQTGVPARIALAAGSISYVLAVIAGVVTAGLLQRRLNDPSLLALAPPAFAVFLGTFVHLQLYLLAVPLALVLATRTQSRVAALALFLSSIPWQWAIMTLFLIPSIAVSTILFTRLWMSRSLLVCTAAGLASGAAMFAAAFWYIHAAPASLPAFTYHANPNALSEYTWIAAERLYGPIGAAPAAQLARLLSVAALGCILVMAYLTAQPLRDQRA
jgi:hypothetical protein